MFLSGGSNPKPGEISLAHQGILFLDEFTEFARSALEKLREPIETGKINIARANQSVQYPAEFLLVAACNPCKCGFVGDGTGRCNCSANSIEHYRAKLSGPMLDRIDMHVRLQRVDIKTLQNDNVDLDTSKMVRERVTNVRSAQLKQRGKLNSQLTVKELEQYCVMDGAVMSFLENVCNRLNMSARAYHRLIKLARTIADMEEAKNINQQHVSEAVSFRALDRR